MFTNNNNPKGLPPLRKTTTTSPVRASPVRTRCVYIYRGKISYLTLFVFSFVSTNSRSPVQTVYVSRAGGGLGGGGGSFGGGGGLGGGGRSFGGGLISTSSPTQSQVLPSSSFRYASFFEAIQ